MASSTTATTVVQGGTFNSQQLMGLIHEEWPKAVDIVTQWDWDQASGAVWGQHDAGFLGWCDALQRIGVTIDVEGLSLVARNAGWWWPMRDAVILTDRPDTLLRDTKGRLHCTTGPALRYRDGRPRAAVRVCGCRNARPRRRAGLAPLLSPRMVFCQAAAAGQARLYGRSGIRGGPARTLNSQRQCRM